MKRLAALCLLMLASFPAHGSTLLRLHEGAYDSDAQAYFNTLAANSCTTPSVAFQRAVSAYIVAEKASGNWGSQDAEYILTTTDSCTAGTNLAQPNLYKVTWSGACTFSVANGLRGDGSTCYGDTNVAMNATGRMSQNSAHMEAWVAGSQGRALGNLASSVVFGLVTSARNTALLSNTAITDTGGVGLSAADRSSSSAVTTWLNGVATTVGAANTSTPPTSSDIVICRLATLFCNSTISEYFAGFGAPMNGEDSHYTNVRNLLLALGVTGI